jgi:hypothetical protein
MCIAKIKTPARTETKNAVPINIFSFDFVSLHSSRIRNSFFLKTIARKRQIIIFHTKNVPASGKCNATNTLLITTPREIDVAMEKPIRSENPCMRGKKSVMRYPGIKMNGRTSRKLMI